MPRQVVPLTDAKCRQAKHKPTGGNRLFDGGGLYLEMVKSGSKFWRMKYRRPGTKKETSLTFGEYPDMPLARLRTDPHDDARTDLASTFNTVGVAIEHDKRFQEEVQHLEAGGAVLHAYVAPAALTDEQLAILAHTCAVIDTILGLLDVPTLWAAEKVAVALMRADRAGA